MGCDVGAREGGGRRRELGVLRALSVVPGMAEALRNAHPLQLLSDLLGLVGTH